MDLSFNFQVIRPFMQQRNRCKVLPPGQNHFPINSIPNIEESHGTHSVGYQIILSQILAIQNNNHT